MAKKLKTYYFEIGPEEYDSDMKKFKKVFLDKKEIYRLTFETYMGNRIDHTKFLIEALSKEIGKTVNKDHLSRAMKLGIIEI